MPAPPVTFLTHTYSTSTDIVISATHNPYYDNGIKFFCAEELKVPNQVELKIEAMLAELFSYVS